MRIIVFNLKGIIIDEHVKEKKHFKMDHTKKNEQLHHVNRSNHKTYESEQYFHLHTSNQGTDINLVPKRTTIKNAHSG